jgi:hypothetical protein
MYCCCYEVVAAVAAAAVAVGVLTLPVIRGGDISVSVQSSWWCMVVRREESRFRLYFSLFVDPSFAVVLLW